MARVLLDQRSGSWFTWTSVGGWHPLDVQIDGRKVAARTTGASSARTALLLHGLGAGQRSWNRVAKGLPEDLRIVTFDCAGHGRSDPRRAYSVDSMLADVRAVLDTAGVEPGYVLVGHSMGADLALLHVSQETDCGGLVLVDGGLPIAPPEADWASFAALQDRFFFKAMTYVGRKLGVVPSMSLEEIRALTEDLESRRVDFPSLVAALGIPVMYVIGERADKVSDGEEILVAKMEAVARLQQVVPEPAIEYLPCGHMVPMRQPAELARLIERFTRSID